VADDKTEKEEAALALVKDRREKAFKAIRSDIENYWLNAAFISGRQWLWVNNHTHQVEELPRDSGRVRATVNRLWPDSRTVISKLDQRELTFSVMPTAADDAHLRGAALSESVLEDVRVAHGWEGLRVRNLWGTWKGGTAAICVDWDPNAGSPITAISAKEGGTGDVVFEGDTIEDPLSIAEFAVEPGSRDPVRARWWVKQKALPPEEVQATWKLEDVPDADAKAGLSSLQQAVMAEEHDRENVDLTLVTTYYERPNAQNDKGRIVVIVGDNVVFDKPWPFPFKDRLNLAVTYETEVETRWTGDTVVTQARPIQVLYNAAHSSIAEHMKEVAVARMAVPQSSSDLMDSLSDQPGEQFVYADGMEKPDYMSPPQMPNWWVERPNELRAEIDDLLGIHDVSRGKAPVNIESGYGLSILSEQDNTPIAKMAKSMAIAWSEVASMVLEIYGNMVRHTREAIVAAPGQPPETANWTGESLMGQYRATVPIDAVLPRSRAAMMEAAKEMVQMGLVQDIETFSLIAELPGQRQFIERMKPDVARARRENAMMAIGQVRLPGEFDDHAQHITEHNVFRKSEQWDRLPDEIRNLINTHITAHETLAAEAMGKARAQAAVDPATAAIPHGDGRPMIPMGELPPEALDPNNLPGQVEDVMSDGEVQPAPTEEELLAASLGDEFQPL
jgi:hypothetical protein